MTLLQTPGDKTSTYVLECNR